MDMILNKIIEALKSNCECDAVFCVFLNEHNHILCHSSDAALAVCSILEALTGLSFDIYYHDADFTTEDILQETYEVYKCTDANSGHWEGVD